MHLIPTVIIIIIKVLQRKTKNNCNPLVWCDWFCNQIILLFSSVVESFLSYLFHLFSAWLLYRCWSPYTRRVFYLWCLIETRTKSSSQNKEMSNLHEISYCIKHSLEYHSFLFVICFSSFICHTWFYFPILFVRVLSF